MPVRGASLLAMRCCILQGTIEGGSGRTPGIHAIPVLWGRISGMTLAQLLANDVGGFGRPRLQRGVHRLLGEYAMASGASAVAKRGRLGRLEANGLSVTELARH
jgi:hypothetical protein